MKLKIWPQVKVLTWPDQNILCCISVDSSRQNKHTKLILKPASCLMSQSKVIARELMVTHDDVTRPSLLIAEVIGVPVNFNG